MSTTGTSTAHACETLRPSEWGITPVEVSAAEAWVADILDPDTGGMVGYTYVPETLALWTTDEPYYNELIPVPFTPTGGHSWAFNTYENFQINPFTGYCVDHWSLLYGVLPGGAYVANVEYITEDCAPAMYEPGFMKAPIPIIPFMVDSYTPPRNPNFPDIPPIPWEDIESLLYNSLRNSNATGCLAYAWNEATKTFTISNDYDGRSGIVLAGSISGCNVLPYPDDGNIYALAWVGGRLDWLPISECQHSSGTSV